MVKQNKLLEEKEKGEKQLQELLQDIKNLPDRNKSLVQNEHLNQYTTPITNSTTTQNSPEIQQKYDILLTGKTTNNKKPSKATLRERTTAKIVLLHNTGKSATFLIVGYLPEDANVVHHYLHKRIIPSNAWQETAQGLANALQEASTTPSKVFVEDSATGSFQVDQIVAQVSTQ